MWFVRNFSLKLQFETSRVYFREFYKSCIFSLFHLDKFEFDSTVLADLAVCYHYRKTDSRIANRIRSEIVRTRSVRYHPARGLHKKVYKIKYEIIWYFIYIFLIKWTFIKTPQWSQIHCHSRLYSLKHRQNSFSQRNSLSYRH